MSELDDLKVIVEANQQYNLTEHTEIHEAIDFERIQRIAGDAVVLGQLDTVNVRITAVSSALGNEVIARTLGDQVSDGLYAGLSNRFITEWEDLTSQLSDLSIDTANAVTKLQNDIKAVDLKVDVMTITLRNEAQALFTQYDDRLKELDQRVAKYEVMLQDITMDSTRITMDNGEIELGAWTILSQAREWDLEIIRDLKKYKLDTTEDLNQALEDLQNQIPNEQDVINKAMDQLGNTPIIKGIQDSISSNIDSINGLGERIDFESALQQQNLNDLATLTAGNLLRETTTLADRITTETAQRIDAVTREADIRELQIEGINTSISEETAERIEEIRLLNDGLTAEVNSRIEGDQNITTALENYKASNDLALANVRNTVEVLASDTEALSQTVSSLDARLTVVAADAATASSLAASANEKATTALTATTSLAERMESVEASIETVQGDLTNKVDVTAFNLLKTEVTAIDGRVATNTANIASITSNITDITSQLTANTSAISELSTKQTQQGSDIAQMSSQITQLSADIVSVQGALTNKADSSVVAALTTQVNQQGENITLINNDITLLKGSVSTIEGDLASKADVTALNELDSKITTVDGKVTALNSNVISLEGRVSAAEGALTTKLDASALDNIYTKTETDAVIAGRITSFNASLQIGGDNMFTMSKTFNNQNADIATSTLQPSYGSFGNSWVTNPASMLFGTHTLVQCISSWCGFYYKHPVENAENWFALEDLVLSFWAASFGPNSAEARSITGGMGTVAVVTGEFKQYEMHIPKGQAIRNNANQGIIEFYVPEGTTLYYGAVMLQTGNKATAWQPASTDSEVDLSGYATAEALASTNAKVETIDGRVTSLATDTTFLKSSMENIGKHSLVNKIQISTAHLDPNWYYPVLFQLNGENSPMRVYRNLDNTAPIPPWASHVAGFEVDILWTSNGAGWGSRSIDRVIEKASWSWNVGEGNGIPSCLQIHQMGTSSQEIIYIRGGTFYHVEFGSAITGVSLIEDLYTNAGGEQVAPIQWSKDKEIITTLAQKAEASALNTLSTQVTTIDGRLTAQASLLTQLETNVAGNTAAIQIQGTVLDGIKAEYTIKLDVNGLVAGIGLVNDGTRTAFAINADMFYVGSAANGKKPFMVLNSPQTIGGVTYPAGTWIDVALIANATIGSAHIANASITDAHIVSLNASKITAGIIDAERIGANSISAEKLMVGDATNLWGNQHFTQFYPYPKTPNDRERWVTDVSELKGNGIQMWGRDHIAPYSTKIPLKAGDTFVIEYIAGRNSGPDIPLWVGLWTYNINGNGGSQPWQMGPAEQIANLGGGWFRWRRIFVVTNDGHTLPVAYGVLFFNIQQAPDAPDPAYWMAGDVSIRKGTGGELIVNGSVTADKIQVDSLSAVSANLGTLVTYKDPTQPLKARMIMQGSLITVYDDNNVLRVKLGLW